MLRIVLIATLLCGAWPVRGAIAQKGPQQQSARQQQVETVQESAAIVPGQRISDVQAILRTYGMELGGSFEFNRVGDGADELKHRTVKLDDEHVHAAIFYKVGDQRVTHISINLKPAKTSPKGAQFWLSARQVTLHPDGSYSIQFEKPTPPKPAA